MAFSEQTATVSLNSFNELIVVMEMIRVSFALRTKFLDKI